MLEKEAVVRACVRDLTGAYECALTLSTGWGLDMWGVVQAIQEALFQLALAGGYLPNASLDGALPWELANALGLPINLTAPDLDEPAPDLDDTQPF